MPSKREIILKSLFHQINTQGHIIGVSCGSGLGAKYAERGGADFILALNSGRFRQMGQGSLAGFLPFTNSNAFVMQFGSHELLPVVKKIPVIFGLNATDPSIVMEQFLRGIKSAGFAGINNYPTVGLIDGQFRELIEEQGLGYDLEVSAIRIAHESDLFTVAFVFSTVQAEKMLKAGADVICAHLGLTCGGELGAKKALSLKAGVQLAVEIFAVCDLRRQNTIKLVYGGPVSTPTDVEYIYKNTNAHGYIGGSSFDRIPSEKLIVENTRKFKTVGSYKSDELLKKMLRGIKKIDYVKFVKEYVAIHYMNGISFEDLAAVAQVSRSHLSTLFHKETGYTFPEYLANLRINKACEIIQHEPIHFFQVAELVGYEDYYHFSKIFKKITGYSPSEYRAAMKNTLNKTKTQ
jgi:predicted TIM-barrel enzyme/AraC-like DNA-binding protein